MPTKKVAKKSGLKNVKVTPARKGSTKKKANKSKGGY